MKKDYDDFEELDDDIIDDEVIDDEIEDLDEIYDEPVKPVKKQAKATRKAPAKKKSKKGVKVAIISSSVAVGVIAIALVTLFVILPAVGITVFGGVGGSAKLYYDSEAPFGLYFYGDNHKVLNGGKDSDIDMVRASTTLEKSYFDPSKPTIIWTHGWESTGSFGDAYLCAGGNTRKEMPTYDVNYAQELKKKGYNVGTFQYQGYYGKLDNYAKSLDSIWKFTTVKVTGYKYSLSYMFASELATILGEDYSKSVTLVGHSCGGFVSTATAYMLQTFYQEKAFKNKNLVPSRLILEDPYVDGVENTKFADGQLMCGTKDNIKDRTKCEVVLDMIASLGKNSNTAIDVYLGMAGASTTFIEGGDHFTAALEYCTVMDMTGMKQWKGALGNIHVLTRDWVWASMLGDTLNDDKGNPAPTGARTDEEIIALRGKLYQQTAKGFCWAGGTGVTEVIKNVKDTSGFKFS